MLPISSTFHILSLLSLSERSFSILLFALLSLFFHFSSLFLFSLLCMNLPWFDIALYSRLFHYPDFSGGGCRRFRYQRPQATYSCHCCNCSMGFLTASSALFRIEIREWVREMRRKPEIGRCDLTVCFRELRVQPSTSSNRFSADGCDIVDCIESQFKILSINFLNV